MKKKFNVIQINGFTGMFLVFFVIGCAITGFLLFPSWCCMSGWNLLANLFDLPTMNIYHGALFWLIICLSIFASFQGRSPLKFGRISSTSPQDLKETFKKMQENNLSSKENISNYQSKPPFNNSAQMSPFVNTKTFLNNENNNLEIKTNNEEDTTIKKEN